MAINNPMAGEGYAPAYQVSATPFATSSIVQLGEIRRVDFPCVSRFFTVKNNSAGTVLAVGFTRNGLKPENSNMFFLSGSESYSAELRTTKLFLSGASGNPNFSLIAGLTIIDKNNAMALTGSNGFDGVG